MFYNFSDTTQVPLKKKLLNFFQYCLNYLFKYISINSLR